MFPHSLIRLINCSLWLACLLTARLSIAQVQTMDTMQTDERIVFLRAVSRKYFADTTKVMAMLDSARTFCEDRDDAFMVWYVTLLQVHYQYIYQHNELPQKIAFLKSKQAYFDQSPYPVIRATYYCHLSNEYFRNLEFTEAFKFYFRSRQIFEQIGYQDIPEAVDYLYYFFRFHYYFEDYRTAIHYVSLAEKYNKWKLIADWFLINNRGVAYLKINDYSNAKKAFLETIAVAKAGHNDTYVGIGSGNYGNTLRLEGKFKESLPYLYKDVAINEKEVPDNSAITCLYIAYSLIKLDSLAKAQTYIKRSLQLQPNWFWSNYGPMYYEVNALYYQKAGNLEAAIRYKDSLVVKKDSLRRIFDNRLLAAAQAQMAAEKYLNDLANIEAEKDNALLRRNIFIAVLVIVTIAIIYAVNQRRKREKQAQEAEKKRADDLLAHATEQLALYMENLKDKNELIEKMTLELTQSESHSPEAAIVDTRIESLRQSVILTETNWLEFKQLFERVYPHFFDNLLTKYQDLTPAEVRLLALLKLNIASREMAYMLGVSIESLRKSRYRLRKKLETQQADTDLRGLIEHL
ncbi:helix-turn-helix transcriptional regulator [Spirosoma aerolatum]|uniref:helix-turn-helix transcriptional regulator n=1 Tax=Spirosoma aerolatum TaxID=1211326 RepID=UPI0009AC5933|nr:helix-turn-helix transcriptional regulator [Spirosoma aerolatum]